MANIWRPFDEPVEARHRLNIKVGDNEKEIVMNAYLHLSHQGWNAVLKKSTGRYQARAVEFQSGRLLLADCGGNVYQTNSTNCEGKTRQVPLLLALLLLLPLLAK